jgi:hypothetical protein
MMLLYGVTLSMTRDGRQVVEPYTHAVRVVDGREITLCGRVPCVVHRCNGAGVFRVNCPDCLRKQKEAIP